MTYTIIVISIIVAVAVGFLVGKYISGKDGGPAFAANEPSSTNVPEKLGETNQEKISELNDTIKSLRDDIEIAKEDLEEYKGKLVKKKEELDKLTDEKKQIEENFEEVSSELELKKSELVTKSKSLEFVLELLTAPRTRNASLSQLESKVDSICESINDLKNFFVKLENCKLDAEAFDYLFNSGPAAWAINAKRIWIQGKTSIAFVGEFSAGKTSIVNRILSQDDMNVPLLPVKTEATTAIPTYVSGGVGTTYQFVSPNNEIRGISEATFKNVSKGVLEQVKGVASLIKYFVMTYKNPNLDKLSVLDTPGFNSNDKDDAERTIEVINECDALFWVVDVNAGTLNKTSIDIIKNHLKKPLYIVINKVDTKAPSGVDKVEKDVKSALSSAGITANGFIRFSKKAPLKDVMTPIKSVKHDGNRESYIRTLLEYMEAITEQYAKDECGAYNKAIALKKECDKITRRYKKAIKTVRDSCNDAVSIPQFKQHKWNLFKDANYEMPVGDYGDMCSLLGSIENEVSSKLETLYDEMNDKAKQQETAWANHSNIKLECQQLEHYYELITKKIEGLKK